MGKCLKIVNMDAKLSKPAQCLKKRAKLAKLADVVIVDPQNCRNLQKFQKQFAERCRNCKHLCRFKSAQCSWRT